MNIRRVFCVVVFAALGMATALAQDLTLDDILKKNQDAIGGADAIGKVQTMKTSMKMVMMGGQMEAPMTMQFKRPNMVRTEVQVQGQTIVSAYDGTVAWMINPLAGSSEPQKMDEKSAASLSSSDLDSAFSSLAGLKAAGNTVELLGKEEVEGTQAYKIKVTRKNGQIGTFYLDAKTFLPFKVVAKVTQMGQEMEVETYPSNYKKIEGLMYPHAMEGKVGGQTMMQMIVDKIEINTPLDDSIFKMPAAKPAEKK